MLMLISENFQWRGRVYRAGDKPEDAVLNVSKKDMIAELDLGHHPVSNKWISPLLNHCIPGDDEAVDLLGGDKKEEKEDDTEEIETIRAEFDTIGKAYDRRWQLNRLKTELAKAKKETGE